MKAITIMLFAILLVSALFGQWSSIAPFPTPIATGNGEQVIPKTAITSTGNVWVSRFDNAATGNYDVYLQMFNQQGISQLGASGVAVSTQPSMTWLTDYDMTADQEGNAIVAFQDIRNSGVNNVFIYKVSPQGNQIWTPNGIALSTDTSTDYANYSPKVLCTSDNSVYAAWQRSDPANDQIIIHRLSPTGEKLWGESGVVLSLTTGKHTWPQLLESQNGDILLKYFVDSGPFWAPNRHMFVSRFNNQGVLQWNTTITNAGGISAWQQIMPFEPDGSGGAVLAWYDDRNNDMVNEVYVSRVAGDGSLSMQVNGTPVTGNTGNQQYYSTLCVDAVQQRIYTFFKVTDAAQNNIGIARQLLDYSGNRLWDNNGVMILPLSPYVAQPLHAWQHDDGVNLLYEEGSIPSSDQSLHIKVSSFRATGLSPFSEIPVATSGTPKLHYSFAQHSGGWVCAMWEEGSSNNDIYGMRVNADGSLGMNYPAPTNLSAYFIPPGTVELTWDSPTGGLEPLNYEIYMNNELAQVIPGTETTSTVYNLDPGGYEFYLIAVYADNQQSEHSNTAGVIVLSNDDITAPALETKLEIFPNPFSARVSVRYQSKAAEAGSLLLYNLKGQQVLQRQLENTKAGWNQVELSLPERLPAGVYFLRLQQASGVLSKKVIIQ